MSSTDTYFVAATTVTPEPTSCRSCSYRSRIRSGDKSDQTLTACAALVAPVGEEELGVAGRAQIDPLDVRNACGGECAFGRGPKVETAVGDDLGTESLAERVGDLRADLVAAWTDPRADCR